MYLSAIGTFAVVATCMVSISPLSGQVIATTIRPLQSYPCEINETPIRQFFCVTGCKSADGAIRKFPSKGRSYYDGCNTCWVTDIMYPDGTTCTQFGPCTLRWCGPLTIGTAGPAPVS